LHQGVGGHAGSPRAQYRRDNVALSTTASNMSNVRFITVRTGCQYESYLYYSANINWAAQNLGRVGHSCSSPQKPGLVLPSITWAPATR